jgi:hypothetical protein
MSEESPPPLALVAASAAEELPGDSFAVIVRTREEFIRWLGDPPAGVEWLQVEGLLDDPDVWAIAAQGASCLPLDVVLWRPAEEFSHLYRLTDVRNVRDVRVTMPASPGFMKALRLAASLGLSVRLLPGQPSTEGLAELTEAADFYLHHSAVEAPIEPFHTLLVMQRDTASTRTLWEILERDPASFEELDAEGRARWPRDFVAQHINGLVGRGAECAACRWQDVCAGYFKWPDPSYSCTGVQRLFAHLEGAAEEIGRDLAGLEPAATEAAIP